MIIFVPSVLESQYSVSIEDERKRMTLGNVGKMISLNWRCSSRRNIPDPRIVEDARPAWTTAVRPASTMCATSNATCHTHIWNKTRELNTHTRTHTRTQSRTHVGEIDNSWIDKSKYFRFVRVSTSSEFP